jgi:hypothetical protein
MARRPASRRHQDRRPGRRRHLRAQPLRPSARAPLVDTITASNIKNLKELRPGSRGTSEIRILFVFDPWRSAILLVAGDKSGKWNRWYAEAIPRAEHLYEVYLKERTEEEKER